jgi:hypothetical protein
MAADTIRIQFELSPEKAGELDELMAETGVQTKKELFNNALTLLKWAVRETARGNSIASVDEEHGRYRELHMPVFPVKKSAGVVAA